METLTPTTFADGGVITETQPTLEVGVIGGATPGRGRVMLDTGAAFTMMSSEVARRFGLEVRPRSATFTVANGATAHIVGEVDFVL
jgi:hypothetical protein